MVAASTSIIPIVAIAGTVSGPTNVAGCFLQYLGTFLLVTAFCQRMHLGERTLKGWDATLRSVTSETNQCSRLV
jgi:hypothetical protein